MTYPVIESESLHSSQPGSVRLEGWVHLLGRSQSVPPDIDNPEELSDEVVRHNVHLEVFLKRVACRHTRPHRQVQQGLYSRRHDVVVLLAQLVLRHVHEVYKHVSWWVAVRCLATIFNLDIG